MLSILIIFAFDFFLPSLFQQQRVCGSLFNLNKYLQIHALLLHLITIACLFKQQPKSYHVIIFEGIIRVLCKHLKIRLKKLYWVWKIMIYKYKYQPLTPLSTSSAFYYYFFLSFQYKILD